MAKYASAPFGDAVPVEGADHLIFVEPVEAEPFDFRGHSVCRAGPTLSAALVLTSTACQGKSFGLGVLVDLGFKPGTDEDAAWLHVYVMLSRATSSDDLLVLRAPDEAFLLRGPPADLAARLRAFSARTNQCRKKATKLAEELGLSRSLHAE